MSRILQQIDNLDKQHQIQGRPPVQLGVWPTPIPVICADDYTSKFPSEVLPTPLRGVAELVAEGTASTVDYTACTMFALISGLLGDRVAIEIKPGFTVPPPIWLSIVGRSGSHKTPPMRVLCGPLREINSHEVEKFSSDKPPEFFPLQDGEFLLGVIQMETLLRQLRRQRLGSILVLNELRTWVRSWDQYRSNGKGADRQLALELWDGDEISVHRFDRAFYVPRPRLAVLGAIQPSMLKEIIEGGNDGLSSRFLWCFPTEPPAIAEDYRAVEQQKLRPWIQACGVIRTFKPLTVSGRPDQSTPVVVQLSAAAKIAWSEMTGRFAEQINDPKYPEAYKEVVSKLRGTQAAKLALAIWAMRQACSEGESEIAGKDIRNVEKLVDYFASHARKVLAVSGRDPRRGVATQILGWLHRSKIDRFTQADCYRIFAKSLNKPSDVIEPLTLLEELFCIRREVKEEDRSKRGRKPSPAYEVHPELRVETVYKKLIGESE